MPKFKKIKNKKKDETHQKSFDVSTVAVTAFFSTFKNLLSNPMQGRIKWIAIDIIPLLDQVPMLCTKPFPRYWSICHWNAQFQIPAIFSIWSSAIFFFGFFSSETRESISRHKTCLWQTPHDMYMWVSSRHTSSPPWCRKPELGRRRVWGDGILDEAPESPVPG